MSGIRLVRCPKCDKVLPEPSNSPVYQCGGCGVILRAKKKSSGSDGLIGGSGEERLVSSRDSVSDKGSVVVEERLDMASKSPARLMVGNEDGIEVTDFHGGLPKSPMRDRFLDEVSKTPFGARSEDGNYVTDFHGGLPKSPMRDRFLDDVSKTPPSARLVSRSPMRERGGTGDFDFEGVGDSSARSRNVSKSPSRGRGGTPVSVRRTGVSSSPRREGVGDSSARSRNVSKSPMRGQGGTPVSVRRTGVSSSPRREGAGLEALGGRVDGSPARSIRGEMPKSPLREGLGSDLEVYEERERSRKMTAKTSFGEWLPDDKQAGEFNVDYPDRRRKTWRDQVEHRPDQISEGVESVFSDENGMTSEGSVDDLVHRIGPRNERIDRDLVSRGDNLGGYTRPPALANRGVNERGGDRVSYGTSKIVTENGRFRPSSNGASGPSNYHSGSMNGYGNPRHNFLGSRGPANVKDIQMERLELLRKKKELEDLLYNLDSNGVSSPTPGLYGRSDDFSEDGSSRSGQRPVQQFFRDKNVPMTSHLSRRPHSYGPVHNMTDIYEPGYQLYDDQYAGQSQNGLHGNQFRPSKHAMPGYFPGRSWDFDQDPFDPIDTHGHHPACTCLFCYDRQDRAQAHSLPRSSGNLEVNSSSSYNINMVRHGPQVYDPRKANSFPQQRPSHLGHHHPRRVEVPSLNKRLCRPISGGAPFVICHCCFQLLKLPAKFTRKQKDQRRLQCGACSVIVSFDLQNSSFGQLSSQQKSVAGQLSLQDECDAGKFPLHDKPEAVDAGVGFSEAKNESGPNHRHDSFAASSTNVDSYDFDAEGYSFQSMDSESAASKGQKFSSTLAESAPGLPSQSHSKDEWNSDTANVRNSQPNSSEMQLKIRPPPGSPLRDHLEYSTKFNMSQVSCSEETNQVREKDTSPERPWNTTSGNDSKVPFSELPTSSVSGNSSRESSVARDNIGARSPVRNSFTKSSHGSPERPEVYVNGQAITQSLVKKAEKLAGTIQPGEYWYDPKAGFWGVMGHRCLGIVPPFIREFSVFPLPEDCSRGDTTIHVNGRELHKKDLDLLSGRGLPKIGNKKYIIDISGKVLDEETRDFIVNLGRLAPSVEKNRRGFGMQVPAQFDD